jgi:hypothetical protein
VCVCERATRHRPTSAAFSATFAAAAATSASAAATSAAMTASASAVPSGLMSTFSCSPSRLICTLTRVVSDSLEIPRNLTGMHTNLHMHASMSLAARMSIELGPRGRTVTSTPVTSGAAGTTTGSLTTSSTTTAAGLACVARRPHSFQAKSGACKQ